MSETKEVKNKTYGLSEKEATDILKKNGMMVPKWFDIGAYTMLFIVLIFKINFF